MGDESFSLRRQRVPFLTAVEIGVLTLVSVLRRHADRLAAWRVSWADETIVLELTLSTKNRARLLKGESFTVRGRGYRYEGQFFDDYDLL